MNPDELLKCLKTVETELGRVERFPNGPREIDLDILFYGETVHKTETLTIPHPKIMEREFVLRPLAE